MCSVDLLMHDKSLAVIVVCRKIPNSKTMTRHGIQVPRTIDHWLKHFAIGHVVYAIPHFYSSQVGTVPHVGCALRLVKCLTSRAQSILLGYFNIHSPVIICPAHSLFAVVVALSTVSQTTISCVAQSRKQRSWQQLGIRRHVLSTSYQGRSGLG